MAEERRIVTVLFADLVGSTALAESMDPEQVKRLIERCFERLVADLGAFGGKLDKLLGDAIVALFGAPVAHEDDAERAVRAALRMQETLRELAEDPLAGPAPLQMRIGINTGEVLVGTLAGTDYTAMGDVVNTAARLQALAPPGGILVGRATAALCSPAITLEAFGETIIRGRQQAEQPFLVVCATATGFRPLRSDVAYVGRRGERAVLDAALAMVRAGTAGAVSIVGEAGAGKTRLVEEVLAGLGDEPVVLAMSGAPYGERNVWGSLATAWNTLFGLAVDADDDAVRAALGERAEELWGLAVDAPELERFAAAVAHTLDLPSELDRHDPAAAADHVAEIVAEMVRRHAQLRLTILWFDNVQWASPLVRRLLGVVVRSLSDLPVLLVTAERPDGGDPWPPPGLERLMLTRLPLAPLSPAESRAIVTQMLDVDGADGPVDESTIDALVERSGGNPLFLVELATLAGRRRPDGGLPGTLRALIAARLDQLPARQRAVIENAAVLGTSDVVKALAHFASELHQTFDPSDLDALAADGLLDVNDGWWRFRSDVVREVAYQTLTKQTRAARHAGVAAALRRLGRGADEHLAHHSATAAELVAELGPLPGVDPSIADDAVADLAASAAQALAEGRAASADEHASRALALGPGDVAVERRLLLVRASSALEQRRFPEAKRDARRAIELAVAAGDRADEAEGRRRLGTAAHHLGDLATARTELDHAVDAFRDLADRHALATALRARGFAEVFGGSLTEARRFLDEAMGLYDELGDERGHAWTHHNLAWVAFQAGDVETSQRQLVEASERFEALGDRVGVNWANGLAAFVTYFQRRFDDAEALALRVDDEARRWNDAWARLMMQTLLANLRLWSGRLADAETLAAGALGGFRAAGDRYGVMQALAPLSRVRAALGRVGDAERGSEELVSLGHSFGELGLALQGAAGVAVHLGQADRALLLADQVMERQLATGADTAEATVLRSLALAQLGEVDTAATAIEDIAVEDFPFGAAARALVRVLAGDVERGQADAAAVETMRSPSYLDLAIARLAAVMAAPGGTERERARESFAQLATSVGDITLLAVLDALDGRPIDAPAANSGWVHLVRRASIR